MQFKYRELKKYGGTLGVSLIHGSAKKGEGASQLDDRGDDELTSYFGVVTEGSVSISGDSIDTEIVCDMGDMVPRDAGCDLHGTCLSDFGYVCVHPERGGAVTDADAYLLASDVEQDLSGYTYLALCSGSIEVGGKTFDTPQIIKLTSSGLTLRGTTENTVIAVFNMKE